MEVRLNANIQPMGPVYNRPVQRDVTLEMSENPVFTVSQNLAQALYSMPEARPEAVDRARELIQDVSYPPQETIHKIARLLGLHIGSDEN